jgi:hypothetical protein
MNNEQLFQYLDERIASLDSQDAKNGETRHFRDRRRVVRRGAT